MKNEARVKDVVLFINTASNVYVEVGLAIDGKKEMREHALDRKRAQVVLPLIDEVLKSHSLSQRDLTAITVSTGPGSFTGLRVGVSIANTLGQFLQIPINGLPLGKIVEPVYS